MNVIIYKRSSSQTIGGVEECQQHKILSSKCLEKGYKIIAEYSDFGLKLRGERTGFKAMMKYVECNSHKIDMILVASWNTIDRNIENVYELKNAMMKREIVLATVDHCNQHENDALTLLGLYMSAGNRDKEIIVQRSKMGKKASLKSGGYPYKAPYGYRNDRSEFKYSVLKPIPEETQFVQMVFEAVALGENSISEVHKMLKDEGYLMSYSTTLRILKNKIYTGVVNYYDEDLGCHIPIRAKHEAIVGIALFNKVQDVLTKRKRNECSNL